MEIITELIGDSSGIYALYDENELYYVGRARELKQRVKHHLKDRHDSQWTHFSLYLVKRNDHIGDIESLLIRVAAPVGNRAKPKGRDSRLMLSKLRKLGKSINVN
ncbi:MAG: GIY-YIG nuclease family protein [Cyclobacteriaceae bacterium]